MSLLIDGFNLLYKLPQLEEKMYLNNLIEAQKGLLDLLKEYNKIKPEKIRVVFDGRKKPSDKTRSEQSGKIDIYYSLDYSADHLIKEFIKKDINPKMVTVVTSDNDIVSFVKRFNAKVMQSENFARILIKTIEDYYTPEEPEKENNPELSDDEISFWEKIFIKK